MKAPCIHFSDVKKYYGKQRVLSGIDLELRQGEFMGLVGVNGAGKTTLIKCLLDFTSLNSGSICLSGLLHTCIEARQTLAFLPERFTPPYYLTGRDFLDYMAKMYAMDPITEQRQSILEILDFDPLFLDKPVRQLSKGMSQKLGLAACLLSGRELLVLDEPMSGLDPKARAFLKRYLLTLKQSGKTLFFSTHLLTDIEVLCDRVAVLHKGRIRFTGTPAKCCEVYNAPDFESAYLACVEGESQVA